MESQSLFQKPMVKWGFLLGGVTVVYILLLYMVDPSLLVSGWNSFISFVLIIAFMVMGTREERTLRGGAIKYGDAVVTALGIGVISSVVGVLFNALLYNFIDPSLPETIKEITIEKTASMLEGFGSSESDIETAIAAMEERGFEQDLRASMTALLVSSIFSAIIALIVGAFLKKEPAIFEYEN